MSKATNRVRIYTRPDGQGLAIAAAAIRDARNLNLEPVPYIQFPATAIYPVFWNETLRASIKEAKDFKQIWILGIPIDIKAPDSCLTMLSQLGSLTEVIYIDYHASNRNFAPNVELRGVTFRQVHRVRDVGVQCSIPELGRLAGICSRDLGELPVTKVELLMAAGLESLKLSGTNLSQIAFRLEGGDLEFLRNHAYGLVPPRSVLILEKALLGDGSNISPSLSFKTLEQQLLRFDVPYGGLLREGLLSVIRLWTEVNLPSVQSIVTGANKKDFPVLAGEANSWDGQANAKRLPAYSDNVTVPIADLLTELLLSLNGSPLPKPRGDKRIILFVGGGATNLAVACEVLLRKEKIPAVFADILPHEIRYPLTTGSKLGWTPEKVSDAQKALEKAKADVSGPLLVDLPNTSPLYQILLDEATLAVIAATPSDLDWHRKQLQAKEVPLLARISGLAPVSLDYEHMVEQFSKEVSPIVRVTAKLLAKVLGSDGSPGKPKKEKKAKEEPPQAEVSTPSPPPSQ